METGLRKPFIRPLFSAVLISLFMTGVLAVMVQSHATILRYGTEIRLKTAPVDPTDLLRGDYVTLNYDISSVPIALLTGPRPEEGKRASLYVRLAPGADGFWAASEVSFQPLPEKQGTAILKSQAVITYYPAQSDFFGIEYGIDRYYVPEGQGKAIEKSVATANLAVIVRVSKDGVGQIARLEMNGTPLYDEPIY